jgi:hypothetical protein
VSAIEARGEGTSIEVGRTEEVEARCTLVPLDFVLMEDLTDAASDLSRAAPLSGRPTLDDLGLSLVFGIFDLMADLMDRDDSLVSDRLKEGYEAKPGSLELPEPLPPASPLLLSFDGWFPIACCR